MRPRNKRDCFWDERWVNTMMEEELHLYPDSFDKPNKVAFFIGISFVAGSAIPIIPVIFIHNDHYLLVSIAVSVIGLFALGARKSSVTNRSWARRAVWKWP
ncbi:MAG: VIT1/CCC1 transporter family protein [Candidatus Anammoxibacter sp.]